MDNIGKVFKEASCQNLTWMSKGLVDLSKHDLDRGRDNDKKDDLQFEWGYGDIDPHYTENAGEVERNVPFLKEDQAVIKFARDLMMQGRMGVDIVKPLRKRFGADIIKRVAPQLRKLMAWEGILGCVVIDATNYDDPRDAVKAASKSPNKRFMKFIVGSKADTRLVTAPPGSGGLRKVTSSGNSFDDFFANDGVYESKMIEVCSKTMLPVIAGQQDLSDEFMDSTLIDLMSTGKLTEGEAEVIRKKKDKPAEKIKEAFRLLRKKELQAAVITAPNKANEHRISASPMDIELAKENHVQPLNVDGNTAAVSQMNVEVGKRKATKLDLNRITTSLIEVELAKVAHVEELEVDGRVGAVPVHVESQVRQIRDIDGQSASVEVDLGQDDPAPEVDLTDQVHKVKFDLDPPAQPQIEGVDTVAHERDREIKLVARRDALPQLKVDRRMAQVEVVLDKVPLKPLDDIDPKDHSIPLSVEINPDISKSQAVLDVDADGIFDVDIDTQSDYDGEVDLLAELGEDFEGTDIMELDKSKGHQCDLDIDMSGGFDF